MSSFIAKATFVLLCSSWFGQLCGLFIWCLSNRGFSSRHKFRYTLWTVQWPSKCRQRDCHQMRCIWAISLRHYTKLGCCTGTSLHWRSCSVCQKSVADHVFMGLVIMLHMLLTCILCQYGICYSTVSVHMSIHLFVCHKPAFYSND